MPDRISPDEALERVFQVILQEVAGKPAFKRRLLDALGAEVVFEGDEALPAFDPVLYAMKGYERFRETLQTFKLAQLKKIAKQFNLAEPSELTGQPASEIIDLLWARSNEKLDNVRPRRAAAE